MTDKLRIGALGLSHDHIWDNLKSLGESSDGVLVAAADPHPELQERARSLGCEQVFADYGELLDSVPLDAVYIYADNRQGVDLALQAAARGLHMMIEKPMASTLAGADRVRGAARAAGVQLMVNWPTLGGRIFSMRYSWSTKDESAKYSRSTIGQPMPGRASWAARHFSRSGCTTRSATAPAR